MSSSDNFIDVVKTLWSWRKRILIITTIAAVGSIIIALVKPNYYKSTTVFFAASPDLNKPEQLFGATNRATDYFGTDYDNDRLLTIANSKQLGAYLIGKFNLAEHYDVDTSSLRAQHLLGKEFAGNFKVLKTEYDAISISFEDTDRTMAANVVNEAREEISRITLGLIKSSQFNSLKTYKNNLKTKSLELNVLTDSLIRLRKRYNIYDEKAQNEVLSTLAAETENALIKTRTSLEILRKSPRIRRDTIVKLEAEVAGLDKQLDALLADDSNSKFSLRNIREGMAIFKTTLNKRNKLAAQIDSDTEKLRQLQTVMDANNPTVIVAEYGQIPKIKSRPHRSLLVVLSTMAAFIFSVLGILLYEQIGKIDLKQFNRD